MNKSRISQGISKTSLPEQVARSSAKAWSSVKTVKVFFGNFEPAHGHRLTCSQTKLIAARGLQELPGGQLLRLSGLPATEFNSVGGFG